MRWTTLGSFTLLLAMTICGPAKAFAQEPSSAGAAPPGQHVPLYQSAAAAQQFDDRPAYVSLRNGSVWPQHKKERETEFEASVVIQVDGDAAIAQVGSPAVALLTTSALVENAAHKATGIERAKVREALQVIATGAGLKMTRVEVRLLKTPGVTWKEGDADKLIQTLADGLRAALNQSAVAATKLGEEAIAQREQEVAAVNQKLTGVRKELQEVRKKLGEIPPQYSDRQMGVRNISSELQNMEHQINSNEEQLAMQNPAASALLAEWEELVKLRAAKVKQLKDDNRPASEVTDAEIQLAEARAKLAGTETGSDRASRSELASIARAKGRLEQSKKRRAELQALAEKLQSPEWQALFEKQQQLEAAENSLQSEQIMARGRGEQFRRQPPARYVVTILDGRE